jgi:hypothetical protein
VRKRKLLRMLLLLGVAAAAILFASPTTPAAAAVNPQGYFVKHETKQGVPGQIVTASVTCPLGMTVVALGGGSSGTIRAQWASAVAAPYPNTANVMAQIAPGGTFVQASAGCLAASALGTGTTIVSGEFASRGDSLRTGTVRCPAGMYGFGGGGFFLTSAGQLSTNPVGMSANTPTPPGDGWFFASTNPVASDRLIVTTRCAPKTGRDRIVRSEGSAQDPAPGLYANCPAGFTALSGGVALRRPELTPAPGTIAFTVPAEFTGGTGFRRWFASAQSGVVGSRVVVTAQCVG